MEKTLYERVRNTALSAGLLGAMAFGGCLGNDGPIAENVPYQSNRVGLTDEQKKKIEYDFGQSILLVAHDPRAREGAKDKFFAFYEPDEDNKSAGGKKGRLRVRESLFEKDEQMKFCLYNNSKEGEIRFLLRDLEGIVYKDNRNHIRKGANVTMEAPKNLDYGNYVAEWYRNNELIGMTKAEVWNREAALERTKASMNSKNE